MGRYAPVSLRSSEDSGEKNQYHRARHLRRMNEDGFEHARYERGRERDCDELFVFPSHLTDQNHQNRYASRAFFAFTATIDLEGGTVRGYLVLRVQGHRYVGTYSTYIHPYYPHTYIRISVS